MNFRSAILHVAFLLLLSSCAFVPQEEAVTYNPVPFSALPGWPQDDLTAALPALRASCQRLAAVPADRSLGADGKTGKAGDWAAFCAALSRTGEQPGLQGIIETYLQPYAVRAAGSETGLFTGYYEAELRASRRPYGPYRTPLYARPPDLVMLDLGDFRDELKGQRLAGRVRDGQLKPYPDRAAIVSGALAGQNLELVWVDDPVDAFFVQVQGSGRVRLDDGGELRLGYAAQNGHPYVAIGRTLVERGALTPDSVSMQSIRSWLRANPGQADAVMNSNPSYVFFRILTDAKAGPPGAANVPLTAGRSLAVDNRFIGYHVPVWLETTSPRLARLMVAQDTGGAIRGAVRGDVFWGHGAEAEHAAGLMKSPGRYFILLPRDLPSP